VTSVVVFASALATALATGLGALPFAVARERVGGWLGPANAIASGVMLGASAGLLLEGSGRSAFRTGVGVAGGAAFVALAFRVVGDDAARTVGSLRGVDARKAILIVVVMTVHSTAEGVGVGSSFGDGKAFGLLIAGAIALHNIPEGLAISLVLVPRGTRVRTAAWWSVFSSLPQPLMAVPAFLFVETARGALPVGLGFAAGAMIWMVCFELVPDALSQASRRSVLAITAVSFAAMLAVQTLVL
jgi:ZIP family zinc transporter